jgi:glutaredoxin
MAAQVGIVTTIGCPYCKKAKAALKEQGVQYAEAELGSARDVLAKVKETTGYATVPQVCMLWLAQDGALKLPRKSCLATNMQPRLQVFDRKLIAHFIIIKHFSILCRQVLLYVPFGA